MAQIGIVLADGSFFPITEGEAAQRKKVVLNAAHEDQKSVQIDLLRIDGEQRQYVGCLVLEDLSEGGGDELELVVTLDETGMITAQISDKGHDQYQGVSVRIDQLDTPGEYAMPAEGSDILEADSLDDLDMPEFDEAPERGSLVSGPVPEPIALDQPEAAPEGRGDSLEPTEVGFEDDADLATDDPFDIPDFDDVDTSVASDGPELSLPDDDEIEIPDDDIDPAPYEPEESDQQTETAAEPTRRFRVLFLVGLILVVLSLAGLGAYAVFRFLQSDPLPEPRAAVGSVETSVPAYDAYPPSSA